MTLTSRDATPGTVCSLHSATSLQLEVQNLSLLLSQHQLMQGGQRHFHLSLCLWMCNVKKQEKVRLKVGLKMRLELRLKI